jgi:acyl-homoserine-lactone acylase
MRRGRRVSFVLASIALTALAWYAIRPYTLGSPQPPTAEDLARAARVTIHRDRFGVPHVFGDTDADAAFGLAYAHAEDDFPTIHAVLAASRGWLGLLQFDREALLNDFYTAFVGAEAEVAAH